MIADIDYKADNLTIMVKALTHLGARTQDAEVARCGAKGGGTRR